jgi:hypothetical protein
VLSADRVVADEEGGIIELLSEFTLSGDKLVDDLTLSYEQFLKGVMSEREHRGPCR